MEIDVSVLLWDYIPNCKDTDIQTIQTIFLPRFCSVELVNLTSLELVSPPWPPPFLFNIELLGTCFDDNGGAVVLLDTTAAGLLEHAPILF